MLTKASFTSDGSSPGSNLVTEVLAHRQHLHAGAGRIGDADLDLEPTPPLVKAHKVYLMEIAKSNQRPDAATVAYSWIALQVDAYLPTIEWMAARHCGCSTEVAALEAVVRSYKDSRGRGEALAALDKALAVEKK